jgi:hypothetical protein
MKRPNGMMRRALCVIALLVMPWAFVSGGASAQEKGAQRRSGLIGVVGLWAAVDDAGPAFQIDGASWGGTTEPGDARTLARSLFGSVTDTFVANVTAPGAFPLALWQEVPSFTEGTLRVQFKLVSGRSDQTAGIVFNLEPSGEYSFVRYNTRDGNLAVWGYANGERRVIAHGTGKAQLPLNVWHEMSVSISGLKVAGAIKGTEGLSVEHTLDKPASGRVGLWTKRDSVTRFRQFTAGR